jgi:hypothetical protein
MPKVRITRAQQTERLLPVFGMSGYRRGGPHDFDLVDDESGHRAVRSARFPSRDVVRAPTRAIAISAQLPKVASQSMGRRPNDASIARFATFGLLDATGPRRGLSNGGDLGHRHREVIQPAERLWLDPRVPRSSLLG